MISFQDPTRPVRAGEELDLAKLEPYLRAHFPEATGPLVVEQFPSGHSNLTYFVRLGEREFVLRRPPFGSTVKSAHDMGREFRVLSKLHPVYAPAPQVHLYCEDDSILGAPFYLMQRVRGVILRRELPSGLALPPETVRGLCESFVDNLALLHSLDYARAGLGDLGKPAGYLERQVRGWIERYHAARTHDLPEVEFLSRWLTSSLPASSEAALIHNDYKYDNVVLDAENLTRIAGVLDWEMCTLGDPLSDLGMALAYWVEPGDPPELQQIVWGPTALPGSFTRTQLVERYAQSSGRSVSDMVFHLVLGRFKLAVIVQQIYFRYHQGLTQDARFGALADVARVLLRTAVRTAESGTL
jgi:aminoglycoside phosphotransferase (APT) family kinase protein